MADDAIVETWKRRGNIASARGTLLHWHAEMHLNGRRMELPHSPEFHMFLEIAKRCLAWMRRLLCPAKQI